MKQTIWVVLIFLGGSAAAQVAAPSPTVARPQGTAAALPAQAANPQLEIVLGQLRQTSEVAAVDVAKLRIDKWKADSAVKRQTQENADSITRNLTTAMPAMLQQVRSDPQSLAPAFKLYRNLNVLYEVFANVTESAGAFGPKAEFDTLAKDAQNLDSARRVLADQLQEMAATRDTELLRLRTEVVQVRSAPPPAPPKVIVDEEPPKKPAAKPIHKKKTTSTKPATKPGTSSQPTAPNPQ